MKAAPLAFGVAGLAAAGAVALLGSGAGGSGEGERLTAPAPGPPAAPAEVPPLPTAPGTGTRPVPPAPSDPFAALRGLPGPWVEMETRRFRVFSGLSRERTAPLLDALEAVLDFLVRTHGAVADGTRISVVLARPPEEPGGLADVVKALGLAPPFPTTGFYLPARDLILAGDSEHLLSTLLHEVFHAYAERRAPGRDLPPWLNEGLATYYGTADWNGLDVRFRDHHHAAFAALKGALLRGQWIPVAELVAFGPERFYDPAVAPVAYLESYALVFTLSHLASVETRALFAEARSRILDGESREEDAAALARGAGPGLERLVWDASGEGAGDLPSRLRALAPDADRVPPEAWRGLAESARGPAGGREESLPEGPARHRLRRELLSMLLERIAQGRAPAPAFADPPSAELLVAAWGLDRCGGSAHLVGRPLTREVFETLEYGQDPDPGNRNLFAEAAAAADPPSRAEEADPDALLGPGRLSLLRCASARARPADPVPEGLRAIPPGDYLRACALPLAERVGVAVPPDLRSAHVKRLAGLALERGPEAVGAAAHLGRLARDGLAGAVAAARDATARTRSPAVQLELAGWLYLCGDRRAGEVLGEYLGRPVVSWRVMGFLARGTPEGADRAALRELAARADVPAVRAAALFELDGLDPVLVENATADSDAGVRAAALYALGGFTARRPEGRLLRALREETGLPRLGAAASLLLLLGP
ncbi:MAG: hypothetical protein L0216_10815 [Planctomycetales bacterium]|nr:hypothetical protein [Planctomycetales bacterium]